MEKILLARGCCFRILEFWLSRVMRKRTIIWLFGIILWPVPIYIKCFHTMPLKTVWQHSLSSATSVFYIIVVKFTKFAKFHGDNPICSMRFRRLRRMQLCITLKLYKKFIFYLVFNRWIRDDVLFWLPVRKLRTTEMIVRSPHLEFIAMGSLSSLRDSKKYG